MPRRLNSGLAGLVAPDAKVQKLAGGMKFIEGPVWTDADGGYLVFSDIPTAELKKWDGKEVTTFRKMPDQCNGNARDLQDRLITAGHAARNVTRIEADGSLNVLVDQYQGKKLNSPNDVVVKSDGTIWFTDPSYGISPDKQELDGHFVFRFDPDTKKLTKVAGGIEQPNGLCFGPDEKWLYVADSGKAHWVLAYNVYNDKSNVRDNKLGGGVVYCVIDQGVPDGIRIDEKGNLWSSSGDGVQIFSPPDNPHPTTLEAMNPRGKLIGRIRVPESPANLCFGGKDGKTLFMTARTGLYSIETLVRRCQTGRASCQSFVIR